MSGKEEPLKSYFVPKGSYTSPEEIVDDRDARSAESANSYTAHPRQHPDTGYRWAQPAMISDGRGYRAEPTAEERNGELS
jgi:hypothetical protein